jgi:hypothetical protein
MLISFSFNALAKDETKQNGDWETGSTWLSNTEPTTEDTLVINSNDTVTVSSNLFYNTDVVILLKSGSVLKFSGKLNLTINSKIISTGGSVISDGGGNSDKIKIGGTSIWSGNDEDLDGDFNVSIGGVLPVEWGEIDVVVQDGTYVYVNWSTYSELNNDYFIIEYSDDLNEWLLGTTTDGSGTTNNITNYSDEFQSVLNGVIYIRIKQVDYNGDYKYSKIVCTNLMYTTKRTVKYYISIHGKTYYTQPLGLSIKVYDNGEKEKVFKL